MRKSSISFNSSLLSLTFKHFFLATLALCTSFAFNQASHAQDPPPRVECEVLDNFLNSEIPGRRLRIDSNNPNATIVLDDGSPGVIGGIRNITYGPVVATPGFTGRASIGFSLDFNPEMTLCNSNAPDAITPFSILYNANGSGLNLDLSRTVSISTVVLTNDQPGTSATIVIADSNSNSAGFTFDNIPGSNAGGILPIDLDFILSDFSGIDTVDLTDIQSIEFGSSPQLGGSDILFSALEICSIPKTDVPTLSEWGLIAMAGVLGIVGFMVVRRRKVTA